MLKVSCNKIGLISFWRFSKRLISFGSFKPFLKGLNILLYIFLRTTQEKIVRKTCMTTASANRKTLSYPKKKNC